MHVAIVMTGIGVLPSWTNNVSGHAQVPIKTADLLLTKGFKVSLVATSQEEGTSLPNFMPENLDLKIVTDGRRREKLGYRNSKQGYKIINLYRQVSETLHAVKDADIVHVFGFERMVRYAAILKFFSKKKVVVTVLGGKPIGMLGNLYKSIDYVAFTTKYTRNVWQNYFGNNSTVTYPGIVKHLADKEAISSDSKRNHVLFWREATYLGGGDLCVSAFKKLAPMFPDFQFSFAIRNKNEEEVPGLIELEKAYNNVGIYRFPYEGTLSLEELINKSVFAVLPYRDLTIDPQMTVLETLATGCPVVCSDIRSLPEIVKAGKNGWLFGANSADELTTLIQRILLESEYKKMNRQSISDELYDVWNWRKYIESLEDVYTKLIGKKAGGQ